MHVLFLPSLPHRSSYVASLIYGSPLVTWTTDNHQQPSYSALLDVGCLLCWLHDRHDNFTARRCFSFDINSVTSLTSLSSLCRLCRFLLLVEICHIFSGICGLVWDNLHLSSLGFCGKHVTPSCICRISPWLPQNCCRTEPGAVLSRSQ